MQLVRPALPHLPSHAQALRRGWWLDLRGAQAAAEALDRLQADADAYLASLEDHVGGASLTLPDGSQVAQLPGLQRWLWDGEFCGAIRLRWQPGSAELPPYCLGHIGYGVVPWKRRLGYAHAALAQILPEARALGLPYVDLTCDPANIASQRVILAQRGVLIREFVKPACLGGTPGLLYRISLDRP